MGQRPQLAIMDDLMSDTDAESPTVIKSIENTIYKAIDYALHPTKSLTIWSGTPFNQKDPLYKAVGSGAWKANVFPVCEKFPCTKEEFRGSWPDRFPYEYVKKKYDDAVALGNIETFNQEMMLRIMSDEDRLILDEDICWYARSSVLNHRNRFNFYITTDFATSEKQSADYSAISVWGLNYAGAWFWVDGILARQDMNANIKDLFRLSQIYKPQGVGVEVSGQQGGFIPWIQNEMIRRNIFFPLTSEGNSSKPGVRPATGKLQRFNVVQPLFKARKMFFPEELKKSPILITAMEQLSLISKGGIKAKNDDFIDTVSMLGVMGAYPPAQELDIAQNEDDIWEIIDTDDDVDYLDSYIT
jgi:phage terminase large subunit-like protein